MPSLLPPRVSLRALALCLALLGVLGSLAPAPAGDIGDSLTPRWDRAPDGRAETVREAFQTVVLGVLRFQRGLQDHMGKVFNVLQAPPGLNEDQRETFLLEAARKVFLVLQNLDYDPEDIPENVKGDSVEVTLGSGQGKQLTFHLVRLKGGWAISAQTLTNPQLEEMYEKIRRRYEMLTRGDMEGDTFVPDLMSPFRAAVTFSAGVAGSAGYTLDDAVSALDLSALDPLVREPLGRILAVKLYRILVNDSPVNLEWLSADPHTDQTPVFLVRPSYGMVSMQVVEDPKTKLKAWRFTPNSNELAQSYYDESMERAMDANQGQEQVVLTGANLPINILVDDFCLLHAPWLVQRMLLMKLWKWLVVLLLILATPLVWWLTRRVILTVDRRLALLDPEDKKGSRRAVIMPAQIAVVSAMWVEGSILFTTHANVYYVSSLVLDVVLLAAMVWVGWFMVGFITNRLASSDRALGRNTVIVITGQVVKVCVLVAGLVLLARLFGQDSTRIVTALGIGGLALALAGKDTVENLFGTFMLLSTRPFRIGDYILVDKMRGVVEDVGVRSTTIRTFDDSLLTVPNAKFIVTPVENLGKRVHRRFLTPISIAYDTPPDLINAFVEGIHELIRLHPLTRKDVFHVRLHDFAPASLDIRLDVYMRTKSRATEMEARESLMLDIIRLAAELGVEFAFPTQTLYLRRDQPPEKRQVGVEDAFKVGRQAAREVMESQVYSTKPKDGDKC